MGSSTLTFEQVRATNRARCERWHPDFPHDAWSGSDWSNAMQGEAGEAGNVVKKLRRLETGLISQRQMQTGVGDKHSLIAKLGEEIADTFLYLDLLASHYGIDLPAAIASKFNLVSIVEGYPERL